MEIHDDLLSHIHAALCDQLRTSARQSDRLVEREAAKRITNAVDPTPESASSHHVIASAALKRGNPEQALKTLDRIPQWQETDAVANCLAGLAHLHSGNLSLGSELFLQSVDLDPGQPVCWYYLARIAQEQGADKQAIEFLRRGTVFESAPHRCALTLSKLFVSKRYLSEAIHTLRVSLIRDRRSPELNLALARLLERRAVKLSQRRRHLLRNRILAEALDCYRIVNQVRPESDSLVAQGRLEQQLHQSDAAKKSFETAVQRDADSADALRHLAGVHVDFGEIDTAVSHFEKAIEMAPERAEIHFRYTRAKRFQSGRGTRRYLKTLTSLLSSADGAIRREVYLNFALAKVLDDIGNYDRAWEHYDRANRLKQRMQSKANGYDRSAFTALVDHSIEHVNSEFIDRYRLSHTDRLPVFIIGLPRSGTTLTEQILSSHPSIAGAGELGMIHQIRHQISRGVRNGERSFRKNHLYRHVAQSDPVELQRLAERYLAKLVQLSGGEPHVTDKMPTNFLYLGLISILFPGATIIHCRRDPMDVLVSCYCQNLNLPFCDLDQMVDYYHDYRRLMDHWKNVLPLKIFDSDYETLVGNTEDASRQLIDHCGLEWSDQCLAFRENRRAVRTPSKWQVRQPIYRTSVSKWKRFEKHLHPVAQRIHGRAAPIAPVSTLNHFPDVAVTL